MAIKKRKKPDFSRPRPQKPEENAFGADDSAAPDGRTDSDEAEVGEQANADEFGEIQDESADDSAGGEAADAGFVRGKRYENAPLVVIAGRPNVGKSTLFNRFMRRRLAIVDPTPGVTRDPVEADALIMGKPVRLMDTGGYKLDREPGTAEAELDALVVEKSLAAIRRADKIVLLLEAGRLTGEDEEFIELLRPHQDKLVVGVNKCEGGTGEDVSWNYLKFGFRKLFFVSAAHGDHISEFAREIVDGLDFSKVREAEDGEPIRIAIMGKPNVGKSTLSNRLTHSEASIVSDHAGTTRDVVEGAFSFGGRRFRVLDTAGIRRRAKVRENVEYYSVNRAIKTLDSCDVVFLLIDAQEGLAEQDKKICSLAFERGRGIIFVLNKWDTQEQGRKTLRDTRDYIRAMFGQMGFAPILPLSALNGDGIRDLLNEAVELYGQLTRQVGTSALNRALADWLAHYPPPASRAIHFKVRYMTQTGSNPVSFKIFCTSPDNVPESYVTYLKNRIRKDLGFDKIPVDVELKASRRKWESRFDDDDGGR